MHVSFACEFKRVSATCAAEGLRNCNVPAGAGTQFVLAVELRMSNYELTTNY